MTFDTLYEYLIELKEIATQQTKAGGAARKILEKDPTTHNVQELQNFINQYSRNR